MADMTWDAAVDAGGTVNCDVCGDPVTGWEVNDPVRLVTEELQPLWEGGPPVMVPLDVPRYERVYPKPIMTVHPCGHRVGSMTIVVPPMGVTLP